MLKIGSRGSNLALVQARWVEGRIRALHPDTATEIKIIRTSADRDTTTSIRSGSATGVFVKEIEDALLSGDIDLAVHSMKDLPTRIPDDLVIGAIPAREDARDALVSQGPCRSLGDLPQGAIVGTGSVRRQAQLLALRPDLIPRDIRGNVETRLQKLAAGTYDVIILACAGLNRLGLQGRITMPLETQKMLPAPGQGALALEVRKGDERTAALITSLHEPETAAAVFAERAFLRRMGGGCNSPIAVHASARARKLLIDGLVAAPDGSNILRDTTECTWDQAVPAAEQLAEKLLAAGGEAILEALP